KEKGRQAMGSIIIKLVLIGVAVAFYFFIYRSLKGTRKGSRAANFSVGGRKRREIEASEMDRDERVRRRKVSLRGGPMFKRRH
ncbi:hypothetical protein ACFL4X_02600, partial [Gemmatimonadota bacterium]